MSGVAVEGDGIAAVAAAGRDGDTPGVARQRAAVREVELAFPPTVTFPLPDPRWTVPPVALIDTDPEKFGDALGPLPASIIEAAVMV